MDQYEELAAKFGGTVSPGGNQASAVDYDALARKFGATISARQKDALDAPDSIGRKALDAVQSGAGGLRDLGMGAINGASFIGRTLLRPLDATGGTGTTTDERKAAADAFMKENADPSSLGFKEGEIAAQVAGTAGMGGALAQGIRAFPLLAKFAPAIESGGFNLGKPAATTLGGKAADMATRIGAGAVVGGASAGLVSPDDAGTGAVIGGALPPAVKAAGAVGKSLAGELSPEVFDLYKKAQNLGIDIPADRIVNSKPLNAVASSLNYIPLSGRAGTEEKMVSQLNRALSRTFGQDSDNVTGALRKAQTDLGGKFDQVLQNNTVKVDDQLLNDLSGHVATAEKELSPDQAKIIKNQVDEILNKASTNDQIDGQAAYNIKKRLDLIGNRNSNEAFYARELKKSLMGALNRSLGPQEAADFAKVRQQYGTMLDLENLAQNGAEGGVSVGRLANLKNINNPELQDLADIAAQFVKSRESPHGAAQRVTLGALGAGAAGLTPGAALPIAGGIAGGRAANMILNSGAMKDLLLNPAAAKGGFASLVGNPALRTLAYERANRSNP